MLCVKRTYALAAKPHQAGAVKGSSVPSGTKRTYRFPIRPEVLTDPNPKHFRVRMAYSSSWLAV
jgi:hypothetical protein